MFNLGARRIRFYRRKTKLGFILKTKLGFILKAKLGFISKAKTIMGSGIEPSPSPSPSLNPICITSWL